MEPAPRLTLPKACLLRKPEEYRRVYAQGKRLRGDGFTLIYRLGTEHGRPRLGISVHGVGSAVRRNRIKRLIREFFRLQQARINPASELIFAVRSNFRLDSPGRIAEAVERLVADRPDLYRPVEPRQDDGATVG